MKSNYREIAIRLLSIVLTGMIGIIGGFIHNAYAQGLQLASPIFEAPVGIAWDPSTHAVFVLDSFYNRIVEIFFFNPGCTPDTIEIITAVCFDKAWGSFGTADGEFFNPKGLAVDSSSKLFVADTNNHRIQEFQLSSGSCPTGTSQVASGGGPFPTQACFVRKWGSFGTADGKFDEPEGVAADTSGNIFVADTENNRIQEFHLSETCRLGTKQIVPGVCFVRKWGSPGTADGEFFNPKGLAVDSSGKLYVADTFNNRIQEFQLITPCPAGAAQIISGICFIKKWDSFGQFKHPQSVAVDTSNHIVFVADTDNHKVHNHGAWGTLGTDDGEFKSPRGLAVNPFSHKLFVADTGNHRIQEFEFVSQFTGDCSGGIQIDSTNACFIRRWP